jgi:hypothetical protein
MSRQFTYYGSFASAVYFTDLFGVPAAAYSLRKLSPNSVYAGAAIRVRRSSDNTEQDINFVSSAPNAALDTVALLSFVGAGNGFVTTWYNQNGGGNNLVQTTGGSQPLIVSSGSIIKTTDNIDTLNFILGGNKVLSFENGTIFRNKNYGAAFLCYQNQVVNARRDVLGIHTNSMGTARFSISDNNVTNRRERFNTRRLDSDTNSDINASNDFPTTSRIITGVINWGSASSLLKRNGQTVAASSSHGSAGFTSDTNSIVNTGASANTSGIGISFNAAPVESIFEVILYNDNAVNNNISDIEININDYYNVF